jgi:hypothetical protein
MCTPVRAAFGDVSAPAIVVSAISRTLSCTSARRICSVDTTA